MSSNVGIKYNWAKSWAISGLSLYAKKSHNFRLLTCATKIFLWAIRFAKESSRVELTKNDE